MDSALSLGALYDRGLAEAAELGAALSDISARARRVGQRAVLDIRLHGMIESLQIRGYEMISGIARRLMKRYDHLGWQSAPPHHRRDHIPLRRAAPRTYPRRHRA
ncbi:hypothetical protein ACFQ60_03875 [Streptomyces zhihengii]